MKSYDLITPEGTRDLLFDECVEFGGGQIGGVFVEGQSKGAACAELRTAVSGASPEYVAFAADGAGNLFERFNGRFAFGRLLFLAVGRGLGG